MNKQATAALVVAGLVVLALATLRAALVVQVRKPVPIWPAPVAVQVEPMREVRRRLRPGLADRVAKEVNSNRRRAGKRGSSAFTIRPAR